MSSLEILPTLSLSIGKRKLAPLCYIYTSSLGERSEHITDQEKPNSWRNLVVAAPEWGRALFCTATVSIKWWI